MLDGLSGTSTSRSTSVRSTVLVVLVAAIALGVVGGAGLLFGVIPGFRTAAPTVIATPSPGDALDPAPTLTCPAGQSLATADVAASGSGTGQDTPLAATEQWLTTLTGHDEMVEARQFAGPAAAVAGARTIGWYDHDGSLRATAVVVPAAGDRWLLSRTASCA